MPRTKSILFTNDGPEIGTLGRYDCCQFLHSESKDMGALVPLKYAFNHKDYTERYKQWLEFVKDKFQIPTTYTVVEREVTGLLTYEEYRTFAKKEGVYYSLSNSREAKVGVNARRGGYQPYIFGKDKIYINIYGGDPGQILRINGASRGFVENKNLPVRTVPFMDVRMPMVHDDLHTNLKYIYWFVIRFFSEFPQLASFMMDRQNELEELIKERGMHWYNILIGINNIYGLNTFANDVRAVYIDLDQITKAIVEYIEKNMQPYDRDEVNFSNAIHKYLGTPRHQPPSLLSIGNVTDTTTGRMQDKDSNKLMKTLKDRLK